METLKETFNILVAKYTERPAIADRLWNELESAYMHGSRKYHNLSHLERMLGELSAVKDRIKNRDAVLFALFYHDAVYDPSGNDNEEQSAGLARKRMREIGVMPYTIENCKMAILATKQHFSSDDPDLSYFLDADLSILGADWDTYYQYLLNIREEYQMYPDELYISGRKKILKNFLSAPSIFKTNYFSDRLEQQARENITLEIQLLDA
jgi:predicted metal-dependent HD superfamily phosphohydrolase